MILLNTLKDRVLALLEDMKARDITSIDVRGKTSITDFIIIASGSSDRHARAVAQELIENVKKLGIKPLGVEGMDAPTWVLVDLGDIVVHVMQLETRAFYNIEQLWQMDFTEGDSIE